MNKPTTTTTKRNTEPVFSRLNTRVFGRFQPFGATGTGDFLDWIGSRIAECTDNAEREYLAELWLSPGPAIDAACAIDLRGDHFSCDLHSFLFAYVCIMHTAGHEHDIVSAVRFADRCGLKLDPGYVRDIVLSNTMHNAVAVYAGWVKEYAERRQQFAEHWAGIVDALCDDSADVTVTVRPKKRNRGAA